MEVPRGFEPRVGDLQSLALPAWLWNHSVGKFTTTFFNSQLKSEKIFQQIVLANLPTGNLSRLFFLLCLPIMILLVLEDKAKD